MGRDRDGGRSGESEEDEGKCCGLGPRARLRLRAALEVQHSEFGVGQARIDARASDDHLVRSMAVEDDSARERRPEYE